MRRPEGQGIFVSDCEGPISKNDNAFELTEHLIPEGDRFFTLISRYDDVLADVERRAGYRAGYTLKLITPFLKAHGATNAGIREFSARSILLLPGAKEMLQHVKSVLPSFIVSTSYEQYISSLCAATDFPYENTYCTRLNLDRYEVDRDEARRLKELAAEVVGLPMIEIPEGARSVQDLSKRDRETVARLDAIFWEEITRMASGRMLREVDPVGGEEKAEAVRDIVGKLGSHVRNVMYVGDSITDVQALQLVREAGGLAVSFNGNSYAVRNAEVAVLSDSAVVTSVFAHAFSESGKERVLELVERWIHAAVEGLCTEKALAASLLRRYPESLPKVELITKENVGRLARESSRFRKTVRGEAIGRLG